MTGREVLKQLKGYESAIRATEELILKCEEKAEKITQTLSQVQTRTQSGDKVGDGAAELADLTNLLESKCNEYNLVQNQIAHAIYKIDDPIYQAILINRYMLGMTVETVAEVMGYKSISYMHELLIKSEAEFEEVYKIQE